MKTKSLRRPRVNVVTLGCSKNIFDSEVMMAQLKANQFDVSHETSDDSYEVVVINTCGFIDNAKQESIDTILRYADAKADGLVEKVLVTGCLSERYRDELKLEIPEVDAWFGTRELPRLLKTLKADYKHELVGERLLTTPVHYAYFKISEGCDRPCTFCAIPLMRGKHVSTPIEDLVKQAQSLAAKGTRELILIAQDTTYYGLDIYGKRELARLMKELTKVEGIDWIRLHYAYPAGFPEDVLEVIATESKICKYLDMPLQHISDPMLKAMKRGTTHDKTYRLIEKIRQQVPGIALRTTLITGFPGETEKDIDNLVSFVKDVRFDRLGVFTYSHEENTGAYALEDDVPAAEKKMRANRVMAAQQEISLELNQQKIGNTYNVLFDRADEEYFVGRTEFDSPEVDNEVLVHKKDTFVRLGDFAEVEIFGAEDYDIFGKVVEDGNA